ncbi:centrosomal protein of 295 kDa isoform X2 [Eublepharis macularius]|nr:centrosomal protein of 295 kDa isoform X2 [Eublepharis macularius]
MVRLARDREKLLEELEQMQTMDLARRRQIVAQMPPQLFEPGYRRVEIREEWQRELECAFEDMYTGDRKMRGDLILHLDPQPLPTFSDHSQDDELDLSQEPGGVPSALGAGQDTEPGNVEVEKAPETQSKLALKKLLSKIRNQKDHWTSRCEPAPPSETETIESGTISSKERRLCESEVEDEPNHDPAPETQEVPEILDQTVLAGNAVVSHSQEQTTKIEKDAERQKQMEWLEHQKAEQLALLQQIEEQKIQLEVDLLRARMQDLEGEVKTEQGKNAQQSHTIRMNEKDPAVDQQQILELKLETATGTQTASSSGVDDHMQMIRDYQQRLLMQNRMHKESVDEARKRLQEYQNKLKQRYPSVSAALFGSAAPSLGRLNSVPEMSLLLQGSDTSQRAGQTEHLLSENVPSREFPQLVGYSELSRRLEEPLEPKDMEKMLDMASKEYIQTTNAQVNQRPLQPPQASGSCQEAEKTSPVGTPATQTLEFNGVPGSFMLKTQGTSAKTEPVLPVRQVQFTLPADTSPEPSETLYPYRLEPCAALKEKTPLPVSLHDMLTENTATFDQTRQPPVQPLPSPLASEAERGLKELRSGSASLSSYSDIVELRDRMLASSKSIQAQQEHLKELQEQLDEQREALLSRQRVQEDLLMRNHAQLKKQMEQQQEELKVFLQQAGQSSTCGEMTPQAREPDSFSLLAILTKEAESSNQEETEFHPMSSCAENNFLFPSIGSSEHIEPFQSTWRREPKWRPLKPPLAKVRLGLDLEQHELSAIQELDTPRSSRLSATGYRESSNAGELQSDDHPDESRHEETNILRITADAEEQRSSGSLRSQLRGSWHEKWVREASNLHEPVHSREHSLMDQSLPSYAADTGRQLALYPGLSFRPNDMVALNTGRSPGSHTHAEGAAQSYLSSPTISTGSFINHEKPERGFSIAGLSSAREQPMHFSSPVKEKANTCWDPSVSSLYKQNDAPDTPASHFPFGEGLHSNSKIQQIIDKYTKDLSWSLSNVSSHDLAIGLDVANIERNSPLELFQPLEPSPDFDNFSSLSEHRFSHDSKNLSKSSDLSRSCELPISSLEERSISLSFLAIEKQGNILQTKEAEETNEQIEGVEDFYKPLLVKATLNKLNQSADEPVDLTDMSEHTTSERLRKSMENMYISPDHVQYEALEEDEEKVNPLSPIENFRSPSPVEGRNSFYQLVPDCGLLKNAVGVKEDVLSREENLCFVELPVASSDPKYETVPEIAIMSEDREMDRFQCTSYSMREHSTLRTETLLNSVPEASSEIPVSCMQNSVQQNGCVPDTFQKSGSSTTHARSFGSCLPQSSVPVWERQTGRGIMEEPELTLISSNDVSIAGSDLEPLNQADTRTEETELLSRRNPPEAKNPLQSRGFLPLNAEVNDSVSTQPNDCPPVAQSPREDWCQNPKPKITFLEFPSSPGSLQESFLRRKKKFIEESSKRLEILKSRQQHSAKPQVKAPPQRTKKLHKPKENTNPSGAAVSRLKKVEEVKVCSPEDRKKAEMEMQQRTSRLYNNLAEVKIRKEERERREIYAKNREKAKEFQKKTLEILRAKKTC